VNLPYTVRLSVEFAAEVRTDPAKYAAALARIVDARTAPQDIARTFENAPMLGYVIAAGNGTATILGLNGERVEVSESRAAELRRAGIVQDPLDPASFPASSFQAP
jgi:hypothetical protein